MTPQIQRPAAIAGLISRVRRIAAEGPMDREKLDRIKAELVGLATRSELFPAEHFKVFGSKGTIYHLAEDPDGRFALYGSAGVPGKYQPPHNHTTWATIAGVYGDEHNVFYECPDRDARPGEGSLRKFDEFTVRKGNACALMPDDFHTIAVTSATESLHLHLYGKTLEDLPGRITFATPEGGKYARFMAKPVIHSPRITPQDVRALTASGEEVALLDVREEGVHSRGHLFLATSLPLSHLELRIGPLVPRLSTCIVLVDDDEALAQRAARVLRRLGYRNLNVLAGGMPGWKAAGLPVYSGMHVPSKAFGEHVEHRAGTPRLAAAELKAKMDAGEKMVILDSRPMNEFRVMNIPGALDCPGAELVHRVHGVAPDPDTLVVVNCAGRTRSIIGAQSLINAGLPNKVVALKNGTMGWHLAGLALERGQTRTAPAPDAASRARAKAAAARVAKRFGIRTVTEDTLLAWRADPARTTYLLDVRTPEEYAEGHLPGALHAPGGQLVQATDTFAAVRNARVVLADDDGVRATMTAHWLLQMGWPEVVVVEAPPAARTERGRPSVASPQTPSLSAASLQSLSGAVVLDLATSLQYRAGHVPGAAFAIRARLPNHLESLKGKAVVCTSPDGSLARYAVADLLALGVDAKALEGGTAAWQAAGFPMETGETTMLEPPEDVYYKPYDQKAQIEAAMQDYLQWEVALVEQIRHDPDCRFKDFPEEVP